MLHFIQNSPQILHFIPLQNSFLYATLYMLHYTLPVLYGALPKAASKAARHATFMTHATLYAPY